MKKYLSRFILACFMVVTLGGALSATFIPASAPSVSAHAACTSNFLGIPAWYRGLTDGNCNIVSPSSKQVGGISNFIWIIVLNVIDIILQIIVYLTVIMIIYAGFRYLTSAGESAAIATAKKTLTNAIIGLVIAIAAVAIVNLLFGLLNGFKG